MTVDLIQRFIGVHDLNARYYQAIAAKTGIAIFDDLSQQQLKLVGLYKEMGEELQKRKRMQMRGWILLALVALMLLLVGSVGAQDVTGEAIPVVATVNGEPVDATVEPTPALDPAAATTWQIVRETLREYLPSLGNIVLAFVVAMAIICVTAIFVAGNGMPKWARPIAESGKSALYSVGDAAVSTTPLTFDDAFWDQMKKLIDEKWATIPDSPEALTAAQIAEIRRQAVPVPPLPPHRAGEGDWTPRRDFPLDAEGG